MKAAYKWRIENNIYAYITNETNDKGPFIYNISTLERKYDDGSIVTESIVDESAIAGVVSRMTKQQYTIAFNRFRDFILTEYPDLTLLDVIYYYNMESDECAASASSLKCAATDLIFKVSGVTIGEPDEADVSIETINSNLTNGDPLEYEFSFVIPRGDDGITPNLSATASATTLNPGSLASVIVTTGGTIAEPVFNFGFGVPRGADGTNGITPNVSATASATTLSSTSQATAIVTTGGTTENPVFNFGFGVPRGSGIDGDGNLVANNITANTITATAITTNSLTIKEIIDDIVEIKTTSSGWWTIYKIDYATTEAYSKGFSVRFGIATRGFLESYYVETNVSSGPQAVIGILNGKRSAYNINSFRIYKNQIDNSLEIQINVIPDGERIFYLNNIEGPGYINVYKSNTNEQSANVIDNVITKEGTISNYFVKKGGQSYEYLMANGSTTTLSAGTNIDITTSSNRAVTINSKNREIYCDENLLLSTGDTTPFKLVSGRGIELHTNIDDQGIEEGTIEINSTMTRRTILVNGNEVIGGSSIKKLNLVEGPGISMTYDTNPDSGTVIDVIITNTGGGGSGGTTENTWRPVKVNGDVLLGDVAGSGLLSLVNGSGVTLSPNDDDDIVINANDTKDTAGTVPDNGKLYLVGSRSDTGGYGTTKTGYIYTSGGTLTVSGLTIDGYNGVAERWAGLYDGAERITGSTSFWTVTVITVEEESYYLYTPKYCYGSLLLKGDPNEKWIYISFPASIYPPNSVVRFDYTSNYGSAAGDYGFRVVEGFNYKECKMALTVSAHMLGYLFLGEGESGGCRPLKAYNASTSLYSDIWGGQYDGKIYDLNGQIIND